MLFGILVIYSQIKEKAEKPSAFRSVFSREKKSFVRQQFPKLFFAVENLTDVTLEDTIRYVLTRKRMTGGNISEAQTVIITWETTGKINKYF